jgi:ParB family transcriptional regulator, chromosome partitioning protein
LKIPKQAERAENFSRPFLLQRISKEEKRMAKDEPNMPEETATGPVGEVPAEEEAAPAASPPEVGGEAAAPEPNAKENAALPHEAKEAIEPPVPSDIGGEHIPAPSDVVVPSDKINELMSEKKSARRGRPPKADKAEQAPAPEKTEAEKSNPAPKKGRKPRAEKQKLTSVKKAPVKEQSPTPEPESPKEPPRKGETEQIVFLNLSELHAFKNHPFQVRDDDEMRAMVESVKDKGVTQPAIVRPREDGGFEIISGHRRQKASELAGYADMPCIVRNLSDDEAITQMVEDNINQRENILPSERAKALKMQLEAIKRQGARGDLSTSGQLGPKSENGQRSNAVVAERNKMTVKQVQRYIKLNDLVPDLMKMVDDKKISFTPAVEMSFIKPKNQRYIAVAIEGQQSAPSLSQAQRMRELDQKGMLNGDMIDGIMLEEKKEVDKVIISSQELSQYFGKEKTPREMKDQIIKLLDDWKGQQKDIAKPEKQAEQEK